MDIDFYNKWVVIFSRRLMKDFDLTVLDAAAVFGNAGQESGGFQSLQEKKPLVTGSKGGYGIMQWTGPRRKAYEAYCSRNKLDPADMESNYKFLFVELSNSEKSVLPKLRAAKTLEDKTKTFMNSFLRPGIPHLDQRIVWAKRAYEAIQDANVVDPALPVPEEPKTPVAPLPTPDKGILGLLLELLLKIFKR